MNTYKAMLEEFADPDLETAHIDTENALAFDSSTLCGHQVLM